MRNAVVSVIVPAFNAEQFICRTLESAIRQTHDEFEVIVVDDGSTDRTASIVEELASRDRRLRLVRQSNQGVAAARNRAISVSSGAFIAPLDADDLWHHTKLEKQLKVFATGGPDLGLVYTLCRIIDADDQVVRSVIRPRPEGWVFLQHANINFIGNGSSPLLRRSAVEQVGGYSSRLRLLGAEGCEDLLLQLSIAARHRFGVVPEYLVGYRDTPTNMSSNALRMFSSKKIVLHSLLDQSSAEAAPALLRAIYRNDVNILRHAARAGKYIEVAQACAGMATTSPLRLLDIAREFLILRNGERASKIGARSDRNFWKCLPNRDVLAETEFLGMSAPLRSLDNKIGPRKGYLLGSIETGTLANLSI